MKKFRLRMFLYVFIFFALIGLIGYSCFAYWGQINENKKLAAELEARYNSLIDDEEDLSNEVVKLQDKEYMAKYAREKYLYTKDGELIIDMSSLEE